MTIDWSKAPEGATHYDPVDQNFLREVGPALLMYRINVGWVVPHHCQYAHTVEETVRPLMIRPAWNGEGLPPVGTVCEYLGAQQYDEWSRVNIFAAWRDQVFVDYGDGWRAERDFARFRAIRTAEQIAADERECAITDMCVLLGKDPCRPGVREMAGVLYGAGYRKQVAQ